MSLVTPGALVKHGTWMQLNVIHSSETALVEVAISRGSLHHFSLAAPEPSFQPIFFPTPLLMPKQNHQQGTARVNTDRDQWNTYPLSQACTEWCWVWPADGDDCQLTLSMSKSYRIISSVTVWISYTGEAKAPSSMNSLGKSPHLDLVTPSEFPKL